MQDDGHAPSPIPVHARRHRLPATDPMRTYRALGDAVGEDRVFLLESGGGPEHDCRHHLVGFGELLTVSVHAGTVRLGGEPALVEAVTDRLRGILAPGLGAPRLHPERSLWELTRAVQDTFDGPSSASAFEFGFLAFLGYDVARYIERLPRRIEPDDPMPELHLVLPAGFVRSDVDGPDAELVTFSGPGWQEPDLAEELTRALTGTGPVEPAPAAPAASAVSDDTTREEYLAWSDRCLGHIAVGDIYQAQLGHEITIRSDSTPQQVYRRLRERNGSPFMYLAPVGEHTVVGASPELFVRVEDGRITMRPIAGTRRRTGDDDAVAADLSGDPKEVAEHVMLVDLCRNDIGRICRPGSLDVPDEMTVERYSHVLHLVSTVVGQAAPEVDSWDVIAALFPAGTMTGAPKIRAMEIIEDLESSRRGMYAGALGLIGHGGYLNLALCIRTLVHHDGAYRTRASAGVVADSVPDREWAETLAKSAAAYWAVTGTELAETTTEDRGVLP